MKRQVSSATRGPEHPALTLQNTSKTLHSLHRRLLTVELNAAPNCELRLHYNSPENHCCCFGSVEQNVSETM